MKNVTCQNCGHYGSSGTMEDTIHNSMVEEMGSEYGEMIELAFRQRGVVKESLFGFVINVNQD
jgi:hypothetical protein